MSDDLAAKYGVTDPALAAQLNASAAPDDPPPIRTLGEYLEADLEANVTEIVTPRMLVRGGITATVADGGTGKTSLALNRILPWAAGAVPWPTIAPFTPVDGRPLRTLIIENEGAGSLFQEKIRSMLDGSPWDEGTDERYLIDNNVLVWGDGGYAGVHLDQPRWVTQVYRGIEEHAPDVVFMEPFARLWGGDENSNTETNEFISTIEEMAAKHDIAVYLCHHKRKGWSEDPLDLQSLSRGASALADAATYFEFMRPAAGGGERELDCTKNRFGQRPGPYRLKWREDDSGWYDFVSNEKKLAQVVTALKGGAESLDEVAHKLGAERGPERSDRTYQWLQQAIDAGLARAVKLGSEVKYKAGKAETEEGEKF